MRINELVNTDLNFVVTDIFTNSKKCIPNSIFVSLKGTKTDGLKYIKEALDNGASFIICTTPIEESIPHLVVTNIKEYLKDILIKFYDIKDITLIGITGTDGKTTTSLITKHLLEDIYNVGYIGTNGIIYYDIKKEIENTTPSIDTLYREISLMKKKNINIVVLEVSSHAIDQGRIEGLEFSISIFTNISKEHQDYHSTIKEYIDTKCELFNRTKNKVLVNSDFNESSYVQSKVNTNLVTFGIYEKADFNAYDILLELSNSYFKLNNTLYSTYLFGEFNIYNSLAAIIVAKELGISESSIQKRLLTLPKIDGRQHIFSVNEKNIVVDFAHTPNALYLLITNIRKITSNKIILVMGCCGERDRIKRPLMGRIGYYFTDKVIFTNEDPKFEDSKQIIEDLVKELKDVDYIIEPNRKEAIKMAINMADKNDFILIIGKGNEKYQNFGNYLVVHNDIESCIY